jgi:hypothetical protein
MDLRHALRATLASRRFWLWQLAGVIIYSIPALIRFTTGNMSIPILNFPGYWIGHFIPGNFLEKILVNAFFPGGAGAIAGEIFFSSWRGAEAEGWRKYLFRFAGAMVYVSVWSAFQFAGYSLLIMGPYGSNIFEHYFVFPINFVLAACSIVTPDVVYFMKRQLAKLKRKKP